jgi:hypothetical protein
MLQFNLPNPVSVKITKKEFLKMETENGNIIQTKLVVGAIPVKVTFLYTKVQKEMLLDFINSVLLSAEQTFTASWEGGENTYFLPSPILQIVPQNGLFKITATFYKKNDICNSITMQAIMALDGFIKIGLPADTRYFPPCSNLTNNVNITMQMLLQQDLTINYN